MRCPFLIGLLLASMAVTCPRAAEAPPKAGVTSSREFRITQSYLNLPIKNGAPVRKLRLLVNGREERFLDIELAPAEPDWWAFLDVSAFKGQGMRVEVDALPEAAASLNRIHLSEAPTGCEDLYREKLRPQFHFSSRRGWNNDPNGLVYYKGEYHLFYQHNPVGWNWGNMHWGHAVSRDLVRWQELGDVLAPDALGPMFSGSAVVDWRNSSGLGSERQPPLVLIYTAAGNPSVQCIASSTDGRTFAKYGGNPVVPQITGGNRDPKVFWHEPTRRWVMLLYVETNKLHTIQFLTSTNLKDWQSASRVEGFFECPDMFALPVDGDTNNIKWVLTAASSEYMVGRFDGERFMPETARLKGHLGRGFYAAQTFSDVPAADGRRVQIGWLQAPAPGMPFNQAMSMPLELRLLSTGAGPRLAWRPVKEMETLRGGKFERASLVLNPGDPNPLAAQTGELLELDVELEAGPGEVVLELRGAVIGCNLAKQELSVNGHRVPAPLRSGKQRLRVFVDRTALEVFASDGLTYVPMPFIPVGENRSLAIRAANGEVTLSRITLYTLDSAWKSP